MFKSHKHRDRRKPLRGNMLIAVAVLAAIALRGLYAALHGVYDNDIWFLLATGREIVEDGFPRTNPFSVWRDLAIVVQQWVPCCILYLAYKWLGFAGVRVLVAVQYVAVAALMYVLCHTCSNCRKPNLDARLFLVLLLLVLASGYISARPHAYSMCVCLVVLIVLERYRANGRRRWLALLPVLVCFHVNVHAALIPLDLAVIAVYAAPVSARVLGVLLSADRLALVGNAYPRMPLVVALVFCALAALLNPYGFDGAAYVFKSYGAASYQSAISEMGTMGLASVGGVMFLAVFAAGCVAIAKQRIDAFDIQHANLFAIGALAAVLHARNIWIFALLALPLLSRSVSDISWLPSPGWQRNLVCSPWAIAVEALVAIAFAMAMVFQGCFSSLEQGDTPATPERAANYLDAYCSDTAQDKTNIVLFNEFNAGGYFEWRGYRVSMDSRPELWEPGITEAEEHYYQEYVDSTVWHADMGHPQSAETASYIDKYGFDFLTVSDNSRAEVALGSSKTYERCLDGNGYSLWKKKEL